MDPPKSTFNPANFLTNLEQLQQFECIICTQKSINVLRCKTCKNIICYQCAVDQKETNNKCPYRCTPNQLQVQRVSELKLRFKCPFSEKCSRILSSYKQFYQHDQNCQFISQEQKKKANLKWQSKCMNSHSLEIFLDTFQKMITRRKCAQCGQFNPARVHCRKCDQYFCRYCRPFPICNFKCPLRHQFVLRKCQSTFLRCDICELIPFMLGAKYYDDHFCNVGICTICYEELPQFKRPVDYCQNLRNHCNYVGQAKIKDSLSATQYQNLKKQHKLQIQVPQLQKCTWCQKSKICNKKCVKCSSFFCFNCKIISVFTNNQCQFGHKLEQIAVSEEILKDIQCSCCNKTNNVKVFEDKKCHLTLCEKCLHQCKQYYVSVIQPIQSQITKCLYDDHINKFKAADDDYDKQCSICGITKRIKYVCLMCPEIVRYCCSCLPPNNYASCYCQKKLIQTPSLNNNICLHCCQQKTQIYGCHPCAYTICKECMIQGENSQNVQKNQ